MTGDVEHGTLHRGHVQVAGHLLASCEARVRVVEDERPHGDRVTLERRPEVCIETLIPFAVRTRVEVAPGTSAMNVWPGPIEKMPLVPISEPAATAGAVAARVIASATRSVTSRDRICF